MPAKINVIGQRFSKLIVLKETDRSNSGRLRVLCLCDCGNKTVVDPRSLRSRKTTSCGCAQREAVRISSSRRKQFDIPVKKMPEYSSWLGMKKRCFNKKEPKYASYGGRGITVCRAWENDFSEFLKDMGNKPTQNHSLDRIDVNGNYNPKNCRWATAKEQALNKRHHIIVECNGIEIPLSEACRRAKVNYSSALYRIKKGAHWIPLPDAPEVSESE